MKRVIFIISGLLILGCSSDDNRSDFVIMGKEFSLTEYLLESSFDANGDGIFSNDAKIETNCVDHYLFFGDDQKVYNPSFLPLWLDVLFDNNRNPFQNLDCSFAIDGLWPIYEQNDNSISFLSPFDNSVYYLGELFANNTKLMIILPREFIISHKIVDQNGMVEDYEDNAILIYDIIE